MSVTHHVEGLVMPLPPPVELDLRCGTHLANPDAVGKILAKIREGLVELPCNNCARAMRAAGTPVIRVLHRFNLDGDLIETVTIYPDSADQVQLR